MTSYFSEGAVQLYAALWYASTLGVYRRGDATNWRKEIAVAPITITPIEPQTEYRLVCLLKVRCLFPEDRDDSKARYAKSAISHERYGEKCSEDCYSDSRCNRNRFAKSPLAQASALLHHSENWDSLSFYKTT